MTGVNRFRFLNVERELVSAEDWNRREWPKLWLYNAHYFDDLVAQRAREREGWHRALVRRWIRENPPGEGNGWEPYPLSLRIVNWIKWSLSGQALDPEMVHSLAVQVRFLARRLEIHLLGNHLWANLKALLFAGLYFEGEEADEWRKKALRKLRRELGEQVLSDGGHFERSPMYHSIFLEDLLDLIQMTRIFPGLISEDDASAWRDAAGRMLRWLRVMCHPDGRIPFFNDSAFGVAAELSELEGYADWVGVSDGGEPITNIEVLGASGFVRVRLGDLFLVADVGDVGPSYIPGHAHAESLAFELSLGGTRVIVNGGISTYETSRQRLEQRGTAMHNTVVVDEEDSSEVWGSFRVARRARVQGLSVGEEEGQVVLSARHDGYRRLQGRVDHHRTWRISPGKLEVEDVLKGRFKSARAVYRFAPEFEVSSEGRVVSRDGECSFKYTVEDGGGGVSRGTWYPGFGLEAPCQVLDVQVRCDRAKVMFHWDQLI